MSDLGLVWVFDGLLCQVVYMLVVYQGISQKIGVHIVLIYPDITALIFLIGAPYLFALCMSSPISITC